MKKHIFTVQRAKLIERACAFHAELLPVHSPLLGQSVFVSFPALNNMFKFSALSCLISDLKKIGAKDVQGLN